MNVSAAAFSGKLTGLSVSRDIAYCYQPVFARETCADSSDTAKRLLFCLNYLIDFFNMVYFCQIVAVPGTEADYSEINKHAPRKYLAGFGNAVSF